MIDVLTDSLLSLSDAAKLLPRRRRGRKVSVSTLYRWTTVGCRGVVLGSIQIGGTRCTSARALGAFFDALSTVPMSRDVSLGPKSPTNREKEIRAANAELDRAGI